MANLLYVTCNVRPQDRSRTLSLGNEFLEEYLRRNPQDEVQILDLYRDSIQRVDLDVLNVWWRIERGEDYSFVSDGERNKIARLFRLADQFRRCDKYVFVTCSLNLWFPAEFKMYIDAIGIPDPTNRMTPLAAKCMLPGQSRKSLHVHACSPHDFLQEQELGVAYLRSVLSYLGVTDHETVLLEGDDPERVSEVDHEKARRRMLDLAHRF
ncbi:MAG: NAD(P)H-dependent oxidoreductase [Desulfobacteraceae bacterium]|nr:NAD(P)H-dependent oxidoreductase [Desulfobacteraceae bacterium]